jgi:hypothetical protein
MLLHNDEIRFSSRPIPSPEQTAGAAGSIRVCSGSCSQSHMQSWISQYGESHQYPLNRLGCRSNGLADQSFLDHVLGMSIAIRSVLSRTAATNFLLDVLNVLRAGTLELLNLVPSKWTSRPELMGNESYVS